MSWLDNWKQKRADYRGYKFRKARRAEGKDLMGLSKITEGLYIGGIVDVLHGNEIDKHNILKIINVCRVEVFNNKLSYDYHLPLNDNHGNTYEQFKNVVDKLVSCSNADRGLGSDNILVHCVSGINRSVSVVASYLAVKNKLTFEEALAHIKAVRPFVNPTPENTALAKEYIKRNS